MIPKKKYRLHFIGIGGIGMSGIAEIFLAQGHSISGSDLHATEITERLARLGAKISIGHRAENISSDTEVVVISSAVKADNPEVLAAKRLSIPIAPRAEMLAEIMRGKNAVAVAGTHGKTTTTSMIAQILLKANLDPTVVVGGKVEAIGSNAKFGASDLVVAEADESDGSFLLLPATHIVITNIDLDHMEFYKTREKLDEAFIQFAKKIPLEGSAWLCLDDPGVRAILPHLTKPHLTYGFDEKADLSAKIVPSERSGFQAANLKLNGVELGVLELSVLGKHNLLNALAAVGVAHSLGVSFSAIQASLREFKHVRRRFDVRYHSDQQKITVVDDYGHHPTEIRAVLSTARDTGAKRVVTVFQPHRYTRTQLCWNEFLECFDDTDVLLMLPIYAASEEPIEGITSSTLLKAVKCRGLKVEVQSLDEAAEWILKNKAEGDLILTLGAGSITKLATMLADRL